jgi:N-acetylglucosamine kinase-like BadF-type ATPase
VRTYLGVDGGGTKTRFLLIDEAGTVLATHDEGSAYHLEIGLEALQAMLERGIRAVLRHGGIAASSLTYAFLGLPAYGEDRTLMPMLDAAPAAVLTSGRYRCDNDMVCGWAGALAGEDGISIVAGTGSIAYGEYAGRRARAGGWGELFGDEGSAYWLAREGLRLFSRMSDGRMPQGPLHELVRRHFAIDDDIELCAAIYGKPQAQRSQLAQLSKLITEAASAGDEAARTTLLQAALELADMVDAVRRTLDVPRDTQLPLSCSGGLFQQRDVLLRPFADVLAARARYRLVPARLPPDAGAALRAAQLNGTSLAVKSITALERQVRNRAGRHNLAPAQG